MTGTTFKVGFIGLGIMGEPMATNIIKNGHETWVYDIDPAQVEKLAELGGNPCESVADVAGKASHIIIMVPNSEHVRDVIEQLLPVLKKGTVIIDMSTISPAVSRELAASVKEKGSMMLDAPVVKSKAAAISGDLGILVGGDKKTYEKIIPLLKCMGKNIIHMGPNGSGLVMKLCHNMLVGEIQNGVNEMLVLAQVAGLDIDSVVKAVSYGGGQNAYLDMKAATIKAQDFSPKFPFEHMFKDLNLIKGLASELGLDLAGAKHVLGIYEKGMDEGLNREDFSASIKIVEKTTKHEPVEE
ncbi:MAG TPA: NAD(P)-dependent oxidoreductase [Candidatus Lokiarchaeia archaeon]|nr:NAD(P)-dependent oxidoreductase [Candidatus Lokiarchaeia archaeon]